MALVLVIALGLSGWVLTGAFRASAERDAQEKLELHLLTLVGLAEPGATPRLPLELPDPRWSQPASGLYGQATTLAGGASWRSASLVGLVDPLWSRAMPAPGERVSGQTDHPTLGNLFVAAITVIYEAPEGQDTIQDTTVSFVVGLSDVPIDAEIKAYVNYLGPGLALVGLVLLIAEFALFSAISRPLSELADAVDAIEHGDATELVGDWPYELQGVSANLNRLLAHERDSRERYRHLTDDLAHSLKTPITALRNAVEALPSAGDARSDDREMMLAQLTRMETAIGERLRRAPVRPALVRTEIAAEPVLNPLHQALEKIYPDATLRLEVSAETQFPGDASDLMEIAGNLLDNALKYGDGLVVATAASDEHLFRMSVADNGAGIAESVRQRVLQRGVRADQTASGQGIGLAVVNDVVANYGGELAISTSEYGGVLVEVQIPRR